MKRKPMSRQRFDYLLSQMEFMGFGSRVLFRDYQEQMRFHRRVKNPKLLERDARLIEAMEKERQNAPEPVLREGRGEGSRNGSDGPPDPF